MKTQRNTAILQGTVSQSMLRKLEVMDEQLSGHTTYTGNARWMIPYADLLTLLLGLFLVLYATSTHEGQQHQQALQTSQQQIRASQQELARLQEKLKELQNMPITIPEPQSEQAATTNPGGTNEVMAALETQANLREGIHISRQKRGIVISVMDSVLFEPGRADLSPVARKTLDRLAEILAEASHPISVEGHTDNTPIATSQFPSNWELSTARAVNIVKYLIDTHRFTPSRLSAAGYGEFRPVSPNSSIEGKQKNRRVDIVILDSPLSDDQQVRSGSST